MAGSSGAALGTGEASALSPRSPNLSTELSALMQRVEQYDAVAQQRDALAAALAAAQATVRDLEARTVQYPFLATQHAEAVAENRQLKAQQLLLEEDARKNKPLRDAVVRELQSMRDALAASQAELAKERARNGELEAALQQDGVVLQQLRGELETTTRQLVHLTAEAAHARDTSSALAAAQAECVRLRGERAQLLEAENRRTGALAVGQEEADKQLAGMAAELQGLRAKVAKNDVEHRQLCWSLASAENMAKGLTAQLAASETAREETERQLRAARSDAALAVEAQERVAKATAAVAHLVLSRGGSGQGPRSGEDGAHQHAAPAAAAPSAPAADSRAAEQLRLSLEKALKDKAALQRALAASEQELREFAEQVLVDSQTMHLEREALTRDRDLARQLLAQAQQRSSAAAGGAPASPAAMRRSGGDGEGVAGAALPHVKVSTPQERVAALEHALAAAAGSA